MDHMGRISLFLIALLFPCAIATLATHADLAQTWNCDQVFNAWKPALGLINVYRLNHTVIRYKKPIATGDYFDIDSLTISLLRDDAYFDCRVELKERSRLVHRVISIQKDDFCSSDYCEFYVENLAFGYYCIQMEVRLVNDSSALGANSSCKILYMNETLMIDRGHANATVALFVKSDRTYATSSMSTTWIVVGSLVAVGIILAFALDKIHRNHQLMHAYSSVATTTPASIQMQVITTTGTTSGQLRMAKEITGRLLLLYAYESHAQFLLVKHLVDLLRHTLPKWEVVFYEEHLMDICTGGLVKWVHDAVFSADRIILVGSESARRPYLSLNANLGHGDVNSVFSIAWNCILKDVNLRENCAKIFNVRFESGDVSRDRASTSIVPGRNFVLPIDYIRLISHVLGSNSMSEAFCRDLKTRLDEFQSYQLLAAAVEWMSTDALSKRLSTPPTGRSHDLSWILNG